MVDFRFEKLEGCQFESVAGGLSVLSTHYGPPKLLSK